MGAGQALEYAWIQYRIAADQTASSGLTQPVRAILDFATDAGSSPGAFFDKATASRFRALIACKVRVSYSVKINANANGTGAEIRVLKNGTALTWTSSGAPGRSTVAEGASVKRTFRIDMAANDYLEIDIGVLAVLSSVTAKVAGTAFLMELVRRQ